MNLPLYNNSQSYFCPVTSSAALRCQIISMILEVAILSKPIPVQSSPSALNECRCGCTTLCCSIEDAPSSHQPHLAMPPPEWAIDEELLRALCEEDSEDDYTEADPVLDDWYLRRVQQTLHQTSFNPNSDRFLPRYWTPEEEIRVRTIYLGSQRRPWYRKMQALRSVCSFYCSIV